ncbi:hypothetical protein ATO49_02930 [Mycolicibacterium fortuitum subsp. fortuitum DSM 46621 = ATCC 6841 = JCM 6387]|nr:hypothetical protein ATO49_02930 [Mycolicibacterium fortuitum subsp. fortuitum DSM 46621 = ATCC 6841 = JCM 6387]
MTGDDEQGAASRGALASLDAGSRRGQRRCPRRDRPGGVGGRLADRLGWPRRRTHRLRPAHLYVDVEDDEVHHDSDHHQPPADDHGVRRPSDTSTTSSSETSETSTSETSPTSTTTTTTTTESGNPGYGEYPTTTYHRPRTNVTRTLYPVPGG